MAGAGRLSWVEAKLLVREPFALFFALAFPLIILVIMSAIFTMTPYSGAPNSTTHYVPGAVGMGIAAIAFVGVPVELAAYRERGVLRRFHASGISVWSVFGSQMAVGLVIAVIGSVILVAAGAAGGALAAPLEPIAVVVGVVVGTFGLVGLGLVVAAVLPNARVAQNAATPKAVYRPASNRVHVPSPAGRLIAAITSMPATATTVTAATPRMSPW